MKAYRIETPEQLRTLLPLMKGAEAMRIASNLASVWSVAARQNKPDAITAYVKLGRSAALCRLRNGREIELGALRLKDAREAVKDLPECAICTAQSRKPGTRID